MLTTYHKENLIKLADYLDALPDDYARFHMGTFYGSEYDPDGENFGEEYDPGGIPSVVPECGSAACAVGHGPAADIPLEGDTTWWDYSERVFGVSPDRSDPDGGYMFGVDNPHCPKAAATRIREVVAKH